LRNPLMWTLGSPQHLRFRRNNHVDQPSDVGIYVHCAPHPALVALTRGLASTCDV